MEQNKDFVLLEFTFSNKSKKYLIQKNKGSIGWELGKFICYIDDYSLFDYIKDELNSGKLSFDEFFCVTNIERDNFIKEIVSDDFLFDIIYIVDFDHNILNYSDVRKGNQFNCSLPFEIISKFPKQTEKWY